jgi:hypothetical protein
VACKIHGSAVVADGRRLPKGERPDEFVSSWIAFSSPVASFHETGRRFRDLPIPSARIGSF